MKWISGRKNTVCNTNRINISQTVLAKVHKKISLSNTINVTAAILGKVI